MGESEQEMRMVEKRALKEGERKSKDEDEKKPHSAI